MADAMLGAIAASAPELQRWMPWATPRQGREELVTVLRRGEELFDADLEWNYALVERTFDDVVGSAGLHRRGDETCLEIGYWVRTDRTRRGYATTAARLLADAAFRYVPGIDRVEIRMDRANRASAGVPPKLGFRLAAEEVRPIETSGHTGHGYLWVLDRPG